MQLSGNRSEVYTFSNVNIKVITLDSDFVILYFLEWGEGFSHKNGFEELVFKEINHATSPFLQPHLLSL